MTRIISPFKDLTAVWRMYRFLKREKPEIVHSHTPKAGIVGMIAAYFAGVPNRYHTVAGLPLLEAKGFKRKVLNFVETVTYFFATKVYPNSFDLEKIILQENFCAKEKLKVIGQGSSNGIDTSYFDQQNISPSEQEALKMKLGIEPDDFVFIFVGRLVRDKGINELVSAFKNLLEQSQLSIRNSLGLHTLEELKNDPVRLPPAYENSTVNFFKNASTFYTGQSISGLSIRYRLSKIWYRSAESEMVLNDSAMAAHLKTALDPFKNEQAEQVPHDQIPVPKIKLILVGPLEQKLNPVLSMTLSEMEKNPHIKVTGYVQDVRSYLAISNCLILPSYREGFPGAVLQGGAMNLPCIVTDINGCNEIITDGFNGLIVPVKDEKSLGEAMKKLLDQEELCSSLTNNARAIIIEKYDHHKVWAALLAEYQK